VTSQNEKKVLFVEWCADDVLGGTLQMEPLTELAYRRIIDMIYSTEDNLIDDDKVLQYSTKAGSKWKSIKKDLIEVHAKIYIEGGMIRQKKCTEKLQKSRKNIDQKVNAAHAKHEKDKALKNKNSSSAAAPTTAYAAAHANQEPNNQLRAVVDCAREKIVLRETPEGEKPESVFVRGELLAEIVGWKNDPRWMGDYSRLAVWLERGLDFDLDIRPTIERVMAKKTGDPPRSLKYFEQAIADAHAQRMQPVAKGRTHERADKPQTAVDAMFAGFAGVPDPNEVSGLREVPGLLGSTEDDHGS
jgi:uncharacterized protein YdaU (DUF1376 family)